MITGCSYGAHSFKFCEESKWAPDLHLHTHECSECGAVYIERGADGCPACLPAPTHCKPHGNALPCPECLHDMAQAFDQLERNSRTDAKEADRG